MEELDASDWSLMTIWGLFISAVVLGCEGGNVQGSVEIPTKLCQSRD